MTTADIADVDVDLTPPVAANPKRLRLFIIIGALVVFALILSIASISRALGGRNQKNSPAVAANLPTATATAIPPTEAPTRKPTNTPVVSKPTNTPVLVVEAPATATPLPTNTSTPVKVAAGQTTAPTAAPSTATAAPKAQVGVSPTPAKAAEIPNTGLGGAEIVMGAIGLIALIFFARRLRLSEG